MNLLDLWPSRAPFGWKAGGCATEHVFRHFPGAVSLSLPWAAQELQGCWRSVLLLLVAPD